LETGAGVLAVVVVLVTGEAVVAVRGLGEVELHAGSVVAARAGECQVCADQREAV
jgi:hypothetical protein